MCHKCHLRKFSYFNCEAKNATTANGVFILRHDFCCDKSRIVHATLLFWVINICSTVLCRSTCIGGSFDRKVLLLCGGVRLSENDEAPDIVALMATSFCI
jgi:hypothetical protein